MQLSLQYFLSAEPQLNIIYVVTCALCREKEAISLTRRMSDEDVRGRMHSARPKDHEIDVHAVKEGFVPSKGLTTKGEALSSDMLSKRIACSSSSSLLCWRCCSV
jgi:hypothetical protein